jgi:DNA-binding CsgD family transcriptional regulator
LEHQFESDKQFDKLLSIWNEVLKDADTTEKLKYLEDNEIYNQLAQQNNQVIIIQRFKDFKVLSVSDNFDSFYNYGCSKSEFSKWSAMYFMRSIPLEQVKVLTQISLWYRFLPKKLDSAPLYKQCNVGWKLKNKTRPEGFKQLLTNQVALEYQPSGAPSIFMCMVNDVSHLLRDDAKLWSVVQLESNKPEQYCFHPDKKASSNFGILSSREKEFLQHFGQGLELKDIAENMSISYKTADTHRINILNRCGARNPMAALELFKKAGISI